MKKTLLLLVGSALTGGDACRPMAPEDHLKNAVMRGCSMSLSPYPDGHWYTRVWSELPDRAKWSALYSIRSPDDLRGAMKDCARWLKCFDRAKRKIEGGERKTWKPDW